MFLIFAGNNSTFRKMHWERCYFEFDSDNLIKLTKNEKGFLRSYDCEDTCGIRMSPSFLKKEKKRLKKFKK